MLKGIFHSFILLALLAGFLTATPTLPAAASTSDRGVSPDAFLNPDGTLSLDGTFSGTLDLSGWNIQVDAQRGPILTPAEMIQTAPMDLPATGSWEALGTGGAPFNYFVSDIVIVGTDVFVGGGFTNLDNIPEADYVARWDGSAWHALGSDGNGNGSLKNTVYDLYHDGTYLYAGGAFADVNNGGTVLNDADRIARWDGANWSAIGSGSGGNGSLNSDVRSIVKNGTDLYVSGSFTDVNNGGSVLSEADYIAKWDGTNWSALGNNGAGVGAFNSQVWSLGTFGSNLYASGTFTDAAGVASADCVAMWNGTSWSGLGDNGAGNGAFDTPNSFCYELAVDSTGKVYVGGNFSDVNNGTTNMPDADNFVMWNGTAWSAVGTDGTSPSVGQPSAIVFDGSNNVYVGGYFSNVNNNGTVIPAADKIAKWDGANWSAFGSNGGGDGSINKPSNSSFGVFAIALDGNKMYVGGSFEDVNNGGILLPYSDNFVLWDTDHWEEVSSTPNGPIQNWSRPIVNAIAIMGTDVYIAGAFTDLADSLGVNNITLDHIAKWDGTQWSAVGSGFNNSIQTLLVDGTDLYAGGSFTNAAGVPQADYLAKWNGTSWSEVGNNGAGNGSLNNTVYALAMYSGELYAGGSFTNVVNVDTTVIAEADYIARWSGSNWRAVNNGSGTPLNNLVYALESTPSGLYVGGGFSNVDSIPEADSIALWNGSAWSALGDNGSGVGALAGSVHALEFNGTNLYVGGSFVNAAGINQADYIAKWDGTDWSALGSNLAGTDGALSNIVRALAYVGTRLYVGGDFINVSDSSGSLPEADYAAVWNGSNWAALGSNGSGNGSLNNTVYALAATDALYAGGLFADVSNGSTVLKTADHIAAYGLDLVAPTVQSITRAGTNPTNAASVDFTVTFSEPVTGVDTNDFTIVPGGTVSGATVSGIGGSGSVYTLTVNTGTGTGTIRLDLNASGTDIADLSGNPISGGFTSGQAYAKTKAVIFRSVATSDGMVLESGENTNLGGVIDNTSVTFNLGDDAAKRQYRGILSFGTGALLPDNAVITKVTLKVKRQSVTGGGNPVNFFQGFMVDLRKGTLGNATLQSADWQATANKTVGPFKPALTNGWYIITLTTSKAYINKLATAGGLTQIRLRFQLDDNNNVVANFLSLYSGNAGTASRPQLIIEYYVP